LASCCRNRSCSTAAIAENIATGKAEASFDDIVEAARAANAHDFILANQMVTTHLWVNAGAKLSGGERPARLDCTRHMHDPKS
jgi:ABC-type bacteriocin/lantibiotic exporter with double-glycine peptidase domain